MRFCDNVMLCNVASDVESLPLKFLMCAMHGMIIMSESCGENGLEWETAACDECHNAWKVFIIE